MTSFHSEESRKAQPSLPLFSLVVLLSLALLTASLSAQTLTQDHRDRHAQFLTLLGEGQWQEALAVIDALLADFEGWPPSYPLLAVTNDRARLNQHLSHFAEAEEDYLTSLQIARAIPDFETARTGTLKSNLSALYTTLGRFEEAEQLGREALAIREDSDGEGAASTVPAMNNLAGLLWCIGDMDSAETLFRKALEIRTSQLGPEALDTARSLANLGGLLYYLDEIDEAEKLARGAVPIFEKEAGPEHPDTLEALLFLGEIERALGKPEAALQLYQRVRDGRITAFGNEPHLETAEAERRLGDAKRELGDYSGAVGSYNRSEEIYRNSVRPNHPDLIEGLYGSGLAALSSNDKALALLKAQECSEVELSNLAAVLEFTDERQRLAYQNLYRSHHLFANLKDAAGVAEFLLKRKGIVIDSLIEEARLMNRAESPEERNAVVELENARARFRTSYLATGPIEVSLDEAREELRQSHRRLLEVTGEPGFGSQFLDLTLSRLQESLEEGEVLVDYLIYDSYLGEARFEEHVGAAVVSRDSVDFADCCPLSEVSELISEAVVFFGQSQPDHGLAETILRKFHRSLFAPVAPLLDAPETVFVSPEGPLSFVPFACLLDEDGKFLIEHFDIGYVSAARELLSPPNPVPPNHGAFLIGNPKFDTRGESTEASADRRGLLTTFSSAILNELSYGLTPLVGAEQEVQYLSELLASLSIPVDAVYGEEATELKVRESAVQPFILHIATHGVYLPAMIPSPEETRGISGYVPREIAGFQNPLFGSWITLAGSSNTIGAWSEGWVPSPKSDGILMANEAAELNLAGTMVVTMSACDTASGEATSGDGVLGLRRAFRIAGAEHIMSTLWPISDSMTPKIMSDFYQGLATSLPTSSLNEAQRKWLVAIRDDPKAVTLPLNDGTEIEVGGLYWAINLAGPFLLSR
ncbi:MAG: CHAT domain-containing tetratricopeptide repeat protein [Verrucomicrobiota bacterium]